jgi:flagellar basal body-associated protein FliL
MGEIWRDSGTDQYDRRKESYDMLWLILGIILLVIAIAGGAIVHPILFALGIVAIFMFLSGWRGRGHAY